MRKLGLVAIFLAAFSASASAQAVLQEQKAEADSMAVVQIPDSVAIQAVDTMKAVMPDTVPAEMPRMGKEMKRKAEKEQPSPQVSAFNRMVEAYRKDYDETLERWDDIYLIITGIRPNADYYKLAMPATYYFAPVRQAFGIEGWHPQDSIARKDTLLPALPKLKNLCRSAEIDRYINRQLLSFYLEYPELVKKNEADFIGLAPIRGEKLVRDDNEKTIMKMLHIPRQPKKVVEKDLLVFKPNFWTITGNGYLQFSQNYISDNWYKGGESTKSFLSGLTLQANYDDRQKVQFENKLEWKLGFITAPTDTLHSYMPNNDLFRLTSKLGYKAFNSWYYTLSAEFKTQFFSNYEANTENLVSAFFSPAELNVGLGMDYKYIKDGVCNLSVLINPLNYTLYSVSSDRVDPTKFNIEEGHKRECVWGSRLESTLKWKIISVLMWESRLSYTTNYEKVLAEWENTFTFTINRYLSTKLFLHGRFDDGVTREEGDSYFQFQELLSFGLSYTW